MMLRCFLCILACAVCATSPTAPSCEHTIPVDSDVIFIIDVSDAITERDFGQFMKDFLLYKFTNATGLGVVRFSNGSDTVINYVSDHGQISIIDLNNSIRKTPEPVQNGSHKGIVEATLTARDILLARPSTTSDRPAVIIYITGTDFDGPVSPSNESAAGTILTGLRGNVSKLLVFGVWVGDEYDTHRLKQLEQAIRGDSCTVMALTEWQRLIHASHRRLSDDEIWSVLLVLFIVVNMVLIILFLLVCIYAHKLGPKNANKSSKLDNLKSLDAVPKRARNRYEDTTVRQPGGSTNPGTGAPSGGPGRNVADRGRLPTPPHGAGAHRVDMTPQPKPRPMQRPNKTATSATAVVDRGPLPRLPQQTSARLVNGPDQPGQRTSNTRGGSDDMDHGVAPRHKVAKDRGRNAAKHSRPDSRKGMHRNVAKDLSPYADRGTLPAPPPSPPKAEARADQSKSSQPKMSPFKRDIMANQDIGQNQQLSNEVTPGLAVSTTHPRVVSMQPPSLDGAAATEYHNISHDSNDNQSFPDQGASVSGLQPLNELYGNDIAAKLAFALRELKKPVPRPSDVPEQEEPDSDEDRREYINVNQLDGDQLDGDQLDEDRGDYVNVPDHCHQPADTANHAPNSPDESEEPTDDYVNMPEGVSANYFNIFTADLKSQLDKARRWSRRVSSVFRNSSQPVVEELSSPLSLTRGELESTVPPACTGHGATSHRYVNGHLAPSTDLA